MKPSKQFLPLLFVFISAIAAAQTPAIMWRFDTKDASFGQTAAGDIDGDGKLELVFGCYRNDSCVYALNAEDGSLLWKHNTSQPGNEGCNDAAPLIADVDNDGTMEVIVPSSCNPTTYCFDGKTGAVKWTAPTRGSDSPPTLADIDSDDTLEILHGEFGGYVICINAVNGAVEWELPVDTRSWIQTAPTLLDADGDGRLDFVVATWQLSQSDTNVVQAYRCSDRRLLWSKHIEAVVYHGTSIADLDDDGKPELCLGDYSGMLSVLNAEDGSTAWTVPTAGEGHYIGAPVAIGDLNGDNRCELLYMSWYNVFVYTNDGQKLWEYSIPDYSTAFRGASLADIDGDALPDAVFGTSSGLLIALKGTNGAELCSMDLAADYGNADFALDHAPVIADFDGNGSMDAFIVGGYAVYPDFYLDFGRAYAVEIGAGAGPPWLMFQQNRLRTGSICSGTSTDIGNTPRSDIPTLDIFPSPANDIVTVEMDGLEWIALYDGLGRLLDRFIPSGSAHSLNLLPYGAGNYFILAGSNAGLSIKMIIKDR